MTVVQRLYLLALSAIAGLGILAGLGYYQINRVYDAANYASINSVPSYQNLSALIANLADVRARTLIHAVAVDDVTKQRFEGLINESYTKMSDALKAYDVNGCLGVSCVADDKEQSLFENVKTQIAAYNVERLKLLDLSKAHNVKEAEIQIIDRLTPASIRAQQAIVAEMDYNAKLAKEGSDTASATKSSATLIAIVVAIIAIVIVALMCLMIGRKLVKQIRSAVDAAQKLAEGDLTIKIEADSKDEMGQLLNAMKNMVEKLLSIVNEICSSTNTLSAASGEVAATAQSISQATSEQAASVEETSASVEQMSASIRQNADNAKVTESISAKASEDANEGGQAVDKTVAAMKQIANKISIIDDIAYQTNLLALNAAIEAARAGEHGKGFAVVAAEVRSLAARSQVAAQEIGEVATSSVELAVRAGKLLEEMLPNINKTSDLVQEITAASDEQSAGASQISTAMTQLSQITVQNASSSEELAATAERMSDNAEQLEDLVSFFKVNTTDGSVQQNPSQKPKPVKNSAPGRSSSVPVSESDFTRF